MSGDEAHRIREIAAALAALYGAYPDESAGPVIDQLIWFLLSTRTTVENCESAFRALRAAFPSWDGIVAAREESLYAPLRPAGLFRVRARSLIAALSSIQTRFGAVSLEALRAWSDEDIEVFLLGLPGVGLKVARCVMCFGLGKSRFAVDAHIWRVTRRLGWHDFPGEAPSRGGADYLDALVPKDIDVASFHVNLIRLGREFCPAGLSRCEACPIASWCKTGKAKA
ncbi:MAG TPA: hypothetical protein VN445_13925 [Rectinemataceae bacterium]|nr:hypothetical protein [Rectinemataceae bacterium]